MLAYPQYETLLLKTNCNFFYGESNVNRENISIACTS